MVIAGPVFPEWYWGPIFFAVLFGPVLLVFVFAADWLVRRRLGGLPIGRRAGLAACSLAVGTAAILGIGALREHLRFERESRAVARAIEFTPFVPEELPAGLRTELLVARDFGEPHLVSRYESETAKTYGYGYQQRAAEVSQVPGRCVLRRLEGTGTNFFEGACRELRTASGRAVFDGASPRLTEGRLAFAVLDGTLVRLEYTGLGEVDLLAYFDSLRRIEPGDVDFKGP